MFRFENENYLYGLIIIPFFVLGYILIYYASKKKLRRFGDEVLMNKLMPLRSFSMQTLKFSLLMTALACFILALANPQVGSTLEKGTRKGVDIMIAMDISNSMLAEDIQPNRLEASKIALARFIDQLKGDRIGLVVFAGKSFVQLPITSDYAAAKMFVNYVNPKLMNEQGTDIAAAIDLAAVSMLPETKNGNTDLNKISQLNSKVILVVSDGEDHFPEAVEVAAQVRKLGITIHTIGIGDVRGVPIPDRKGSNSFKKDLEGNTVITRLNEEVLKEIAATGGGVYVHASNANMGFDAILEKISNMNKQDLKEVTFSRYDSKFQYPLAFGLILLILYVMWFAVKPKWRERFFNLQRLLNSR
jgi:Ca-activated chloride channel family protein